jgi:hypothetical protein
MFSTPFPLSPTAANLENPFIPGGQKPFHAQFRRSMQKPGPRSYGIDMQFRCRGGNEQRRFNFKVIPVQEKPPYFTDDC